MKRPLRKYQDGAQKANEQSWLDWVGSYLPAVPEYYNQIVNYFEGEPDSFEEAFAMARQQGQPTFTWEGKLYNTEIKKEKPKVTKRPVEKPVRTPDEMTYRKSNPFTQEDKFRQAFMESRFKDSVVTGKERSPKGALGMTQGMPDAVAEFEKRNPGIKLDLTNPEDAVAFQDWMLQYLWERPYLNKPGQSERVSKAKVMGAYNWGQGNMKKFLEEQKAAGTDIYNSLGWVNKLPEEPRRYIQGILLNKLPEFQKELQRDTVDNKYNKYYGFQQGGQSVDPLARIYMEQTGGLVKAQNGLGNVLPIYKNRDDFFARNEDKGFYWKGNDLVYDCKDGEQCTARANRAVNKMVPGTTYFDWSENSKRKLGADFSTTDIPTPEQVQRYPYLEGDTQFGSLDAWDIPITAETKNPNLVPFRAKDPNERISLNQYMEKYAADTPIGSYLNLGARYQNNKYQGGSHTVRVVGYLENGEPLVADFGKIVPLSKALYVKESPDAKEIAGIVKVPGKEKYSFRHFTGLKEMANTPNTDPYIADMDNLPLPDGKGKTAKVKGSPEFKVFHDALVKDKNYLRAMTGLDSDTYDRYAKIALTLGGKETAYGTGAVFRHLDWLGKSQGISQLTRDNVSEKYKGILSKYKEGSNSYDAAATLLYLKELDKYRENWHKHGQKAQERPYVIQDEETLKNMVRGLQGANQQGYIESSFGRPDVFRADGKEIELPYRQLWQDRADYEKEVNDHLKSKREAGLRFAYDKKNRPVIYKQTSGNTIPNTIEDIAFYGWQSPNTIYYGDAQGDSKYYKGNKEIYNLLFGNMRHGGQAINPLAQLYMQQTEGAVVDPRGQWAHPGKHTIVPTPNGRITMQGVDYPVYGQDETGYSQMMMPGGEYMYPGNFVYEVPMMQGGGQKYVDSVFNANKGLNWVQRLYEQSPKSIMLPGQKHSSTHFMESGNGRVYPTIVEMPNGNLQYLGKNAYDYADSTGTYIQFPTDKAAQWFGKNYKKGTGVLSNFANGGQHGGLDRWFAEKWVDVKTGKPCGRQEGEDRSYPACRPSRRVSSQTPKTSSEMSPAEKAKFKRVKNSSQRIPYNHKRNS